MDVGIAPELLDDITPIEEAVCSAGCTATRLNLAAIETADVSIIPVQGSKRLAFAVQSDISLPLLPIDTNSGIGSISVAQTENAVNAITRGDYDVIHRSALSIECDGVSEELALTEVLFVTQEPAAISEFQIRTPVANIAEYRADGVVVSTAAGSSGYARTVGSPIMSPEVNAASVTTIAPYKIDPDHWIVGEPGVIIEVTRDESDVLMIADGAIREMVPPQSPVFLRLDQRYRTVRVPQSVSPFTQR